MRIYKRRMYCEPLRSNIKNKELIQNFYIEREKEYSDPSRMNGHVIGLEAYLKHCAWEEDANNETKVYIIKTYLTDEIIQHSQEFLVLLAVFANDTRYKEIKSEIKEMEKKGEITMCNVAQALENKGFEKGIEKSIQILIETLKEFGQSNEIIINKIMEKFDLSEAEAKKYVN